MNVQAALYNGIRRALSQESRNRIKRYQQRLRNRVKWYYRVRYGSFSVEELKQDVSSRIGSDFEILMVHSALDGMAPMFRGSVSGLKQMLIGMCEPDKTLVMPAFFFGGSTFDPVGYYRREPVFDIRRTPSQMGLLTELFRRHPGALRSMHPTHSVCALGPLAGEVAGRHREDAYGCGQDSPFGVMDRHRTIILGLGIEYFRGLTHVHHAEQLLGAEFPARFREETVPMVLNDGDGGQLAYLFRMKFFEGERKIERLAKFMDRGELIRWRFHGVPMFAVSASKVTRALVEQARRGVSIYTV
jgi:aminoglycoside 3-N-acetyltransferase